MDRLRRLFRRWFSKPQDLPTVDVEALRIDFQQRYHDFRLLLQANNRALEIMADVEAALGGSRPFGMVFVRSACTAVAVNVLRMVQLLDALAPKKYSALFQSYAGIHAQIEALLVQQPAADDAPHVISLDAVDKTMADRVGSKMANLGEIRNRIRLAVPPGFAVSAAAFRYFLAYNDLQAEIERQLTAASREDLADLYNLSARLQQLILQAPLPTDLASAIYAAYDALAADLGQVAMAMRSSALGEDVAGSSFAGQYRSVLNVRRDGLLDAYREVIASKYSLPAINYRLTKGFRDEEIAMSVGCLAMVDAVAGGVAYSRNPLDARDDAVFINAAWGLPKAVVDGSDACDLFVVSRSSPRRVLRQDIRAKNHKFVCYADEGVCRLELSGADSNVAALSAEQVLAVADQVVQLEEYYGSPQDVEWAVDPQNRLSILQCRPLQISPGADQRRPATEDADSAASLLLRGGITASPGAACGVVHRIVREADLLSFPAGGIMVTHQALPRWASPLNRAAAVVTEQGSFAGHLANVAREFGVPALFNLPDAMERLHDGEQITLDADAGAIHRGRIEALLVDVGPAPALMAGTPVHDLLSQVSRLIVPLNLLDPDAAAFAPDNCRTLHDITRFIHEKAVQEMFAFGHQHTFAERSSKQLYYHVPMQWWILNLDDGFREEVAGKYVRLENITCIPMLAFWDGFTAVPWEGPPPVDGKGLVAVMFRSTTNPALTPGVRSQYAERNYFMISKHYCSLNQRLGYHFSTLEALVSERSGENYVSFQFKGGAADYDRRLQRVAFIRHFLEDAGFRVEIKEDHLTARIENYDQGFMVARLKILGYLSIHTRQLDMIMGNPAKVNYYRQKLHTDIRNLLGDGT